MTLDEAIKHCEEVAEAEEQKYKEWKDDYPHLKKIDSCIECAEEHRQLAEWLRELKEYRKVRRILSQNRIATDSYGEVVLWDDIKRVLTEVQDADSN